MKSIFLTSNRLQLIPITIDMCYAELESNLSLSSLLNADVPISWPPPLLTKETIHEFISMLSDSDMVRLCAWYWVHIPHPPLKRAVLIGSGGLYSQDDGSCELGYSVLSEFQCKGYATEAVRTILDNVFTHGDIQELSATTYPYLLPSMRVLEKCGFTLNGAGKEEGSIQYILKK